MWAVAVTISQRKCTHMEKCRSRRKQASKPSGAKSDISTLREKEEKTVDILGNGGQSVSQVFEEKAKELVPDKTKRLHRRLARDAILSLSLSLSLSLFTTPGLPVIGRTFKLHRKHKKFRHAVYTTFQHLSSCPSLSGKFLQNR
jgi:hypothetical protein